MGRRDALGMIVATGAALTLGAGHAATGSTTERRAMTITCVIRYEIDPFQRDGFKTYAENWGRIIPRCGGHLVGYFLPYEGTNNVAWGLVAFDRRLILREERNFVEVVDGTLGRPSTLAGPA
jgi:NIPSNAP